LNGRASILIFRRTRFRQSIIASSIFLRSLWRNLPQAYPLVRVLREDVAVVQQGLPQAVRDQSEAFSILRWTLRTTPSADRFSFDKNILDLRVLRPDRPLDPVHRRFHLAGWEIFPEL